MADHRMKNDDLQRNMGKAGEGQDYGKQSPGRSGQEHAGGQQGAGKQTGDQHGAGQKGSRNMDDEDLDISTPGKTGGQTRGGHNR